MKISPEIYSKDFHSIDINIIDGHAKKISQTLKNSGYDTYLVGGCIRDILLGISPKDFDLVTDAEPNEIRKIFKNSKIIGRRFKIVHIYTDEKRYIEVTTFRADEKKNSYARKKGKKRIRTDNTYGEITQDAFRRDFTINSLYYDIETENLHDYVQGFKDIKENKIRSIKDPEKSFQQDPVRMLRAVKFESKLNLNLNSKDEAAIKRMSFHIKEASSYRLFDEVIKIMHCGHSQIAYSKLKEYKLFKYLFPNTHEAISTNPSYDDFIKQALKNTDERIKKDMHVNPAFIYAVFLWPSFDLLYSQKKGQFERVFDHIISKQSENIVIPKFFISTIYEIWRLQEYFVDLRKNTSKSILNSIKYRAAYDFFLIRSYINEDLVQYVNKWEKIESMHSNGKHNTYER